MSAVARPQTLDGVRPHGQHGFDFSPQSHERAARAIRRRNRWLGVMLWLAGGGLVSLIGTFLFYAGVFDFSVPAPPVIAEAEEVADTLTMGDLHFTGFDKHNQAYAISADSAQQDRDQPNIIYLENVRAELKVRGSGDIVFVRADSGVYDSEADQLYVSSNIKVMTTNGFTARLETATVTLGEGHVSSDDPVVVSTEQGTVWSNGLRLWDNARRIQFVNRMRLQYGVSSGRSDAG
jgi:lipopolysaccharide export system protein LptC